MKTLHLVFHPDLNSSRVNSIWKQRIEESGAVTKTRDLYADYPDFQIDVEREQADLLAHDRIVLQFPFFWYSTPPLLKKWLDDVLTYGFAYGSEGDKLKGKEVQLIVSVGGPEESYMPGGYNSFSVTEFLRPLQQSFFLCQMTYLPPMWMHGSVAADADKIDFYAKEWIKGIADTERSDPWAIQRRAIKEAVKLT